jgi:cell division transport system ATP-binding protein
VIRFQDVSKRYPGTGAALSAINLHIKPGEMVFLTGRSGAGKSTLLKLIAHIELPSSGQVFVQGRNLNRLRRRQVPALRRRIGIVFQDHRLLRDRPVFDNVALPLVVAGLPREEIGRRVRAALDKVGLRGKAEMPPVALSSGEQQRVGIARAVVNTPPLLIADEPTGNLDPELSRDIMHLFRSFNQIGVTVLVASHDLELVRALGERILVLDAGRLAGDYRREG